MKKLFTYLLIVMMGVFQTALPAEASYRPADAVVTNPLTADMDVGTNAVESDSGIGFDPDDDGVNEDFLDTNGNLGIGTLTPQGALDVVGDIYTDSSLYVDGTIYGDASDLRFSGDNELDATPDMIITADGNVGIGTTSPTELLDVDGSAVFNKSEGDNDFSVIGSSIYNYPRLYVDASSRRTYINKDDDATTYGAQSLTVGGSIHAVSPKPSLILQGVDADGGGGNVWSLFQAIMTDGTDDEEKTVGEMGVLASGNPATGYLWGSAMEDAAYNKATFRVTDEDTFELGRILVGATPTSAVAEDTKLQVFGDYADSGTKDYFAITSDYESGNVNQGDVFMVESGGNVGIGTSSPVAALEVDGAIYADTGSGSSPSNAGVALDEAGDAMIGGDVEIDGALYVDNTIYMDRAMYNTEASVTTPGATETIDWDNGFRQVITLDDDTAITFSGPSGEGVSNLLLRVVQDGAGGHSPTWAAASGSIKWPGGVTPTLTSTAGAEDIITCYHNDVDYYCTASLDFQ